MLKRLPSITVPLKPTQSHHMPSAEDIIEDAAAGDGRATRDLFRIVYDDLRRMAAARLAGEAPGQTLSPTALVHEAFLKLGADMQWNDSAHLYRTAAKAIRQILIDVARRKQALKRGGFRERSDADPAAIAGKRMTFDPVEFDEAMQQLDAAHPQAAAVFELRFYAGLTWAKIADELGVSVEKVETLWCYARAKLSCSLSEPR